MVGGKTTAELLTNDLGARFDQAGALAAPYAVSTRLCLGLVLPISVPANYRIRQQAYFGNRDTSAALPVPCTPGAFATVIADTRHSNAICPNGKSQAVSGPCDMPVALNPDGTSFTFNCLSQQINQLPQGVQDTRAFNLHPVDDNGHFLADNYVNPNIPVAPGGINTVRQIRVVSAYFRLHTTQTTNRNGSLPTLPPGTACMEFSATRQVGCLVKANTCTIGFAARTAIDQFPFVAENFAARLDGITASKENVQNLYLDPSASYPMSRHLWLSSIVGFDSPQLAPRELALFNFESQAANIDPIMQARNFVTVPDGVTRLGPCPHP